MPAEEDAKTQQQVFVTVESHTMNVELHLGIEPHSNAKLQNEVQLHSNYEISVYERDADLHDKDVHSDLKVERPNEETRSEPRLSKYVKGHHLAT